jgi:ribonucleoside-triphosphate reductase (thioredoxin)
MDSNLIDNYVANRFVIDDKTKQYLASLIPKFGFNGFGECVYMRTYSRKKANGDQERWADTVIRVTEGILSIRKDHFIKNRLDWNDELMQSFAHDFAKAMFKMEFLPPGRGLWMCGSEYIYSRGSAGLYNCGACSSTDLIKGMTWVFSALMHGCGIGCDTDWAPVLNTDLFYPNKSNSFIHTIDDSKEGWIESLKLLLEAYVVKDSPFPIFDYSYIRKRGVPLKGFGGTASGPDPLIKLHFRIEAYLDALLTKDKMKCFTDLVIKLRKTDNEWMDDIVFESFIKQVQKTVIDYPVEKNYNSSRCIVDILNAIGACVVAGNIRRSSEIVLGRPDDIIFRHLKDYKINPERSSIGWMSNNSVRLAKTSDFHLLPLISERVKNNGEPGVFNQLNVNRYGRVRPISDPSKIRTREKELDIANLCNPCGEIPLENFELCNLSEVFPTRCMSKDNKSVCEKKFYRALKFATFYSSTVSLLPTQWPSTNEVISRNRRIGVSMSGIADLYDIIGCAEMTRLCRAGYQLVRETNSDLARKAGVPSSIRVTTIKPSGSISLLAGVSPGMHFPTFRYAIRRMRISSDSSIVPVLKNANYKCEVDSYSDNTLIFEFPIDQGTTRSAEEVTIWEQFALLEMLQSNYSDNMVSVTIYFDPETEVNQIEKALAMHAPMIKSCSLLPHSKKGAYVQAPYEGITKQEYETILGTIKPIDWSLFEVSDGVCPTGCSNDTCEL